MSERWDHASLLAAGTVGSPARLSKAAASPNWCESSECCSEPESPLAGWEVEIAERRAFQTVGAAAVRHSGWLLKAHGDGPRRQWRRRFVYLTADRLCYTPDPEAEGYLRYLPLDRVPVRALPRGYGPKLGVTVVEDRQVDCSNLQLSPKKAGCVFSVACGSHTHFFAAASPAEAKLWVEAISDAWVGCVKHTSRCSGAVLSAEEMLAVKEACLKAENEALRRSLVEAAQQRLRESTAAWQAAAAAAAEAEPVPLEVACYEIEVVTGSCPGAGTTAHVYVELCGEAGSSGEHRLMYREGGGRTAFAAGSTDAFRLHCKPLGELLKVRMYHNNAGTAPAWFLKEVRVQQQGSGRWTVFPCARWLAIHQDDGHVMRELYASAAEAPAVPQPAPPLPLAVPQQQQPQQPESPAVERVAQPVWYTAVVCTSDKKGAGLASAEGTSAATVFLVLHGSRGSSQRVQLPAQPDDFERGQDDVFRVQLPSVGSLEKLTVGLSGPGASGASWLLDQVEVTDEAAGETVYFPCPTWLGGAKGGTGTECCLLGSRSNLREAARQAARMRQQVDATTRQLEEARAELAAARDAAGAAHQTSSARKAELEAKLAALQAEVAAVQAQLAEAQGWAGAAEARVEQLQEELRRAEERCAALGREQSAGKESAAAEAAHAAALEAQVLSLHEELAQAQEAAAAAGARARKFEAEVQRTEEALSELRRKHERLQRDCSTRTGEADGELARLRAELAAKAAELRAAKQAEAEAAEECEQLSHDLAAERIKAKEQLEAAQQAAASQANSPTASAQLQESYRVCIHTSSEPPGAGTCRPVCLELVGSRRSTGTIRLDPPSGSASGSGSGPCFATGSSDVFQLEAPAVGELRQLNIWVDMEGAGTEVAPGDASWYLDMVEVVASKASRPSFFVGRKWLDERSGYRAELAASSRNPRGDEVEYKVTVYTSSRAGCGTGGNVFVDLKGDQAPSGVLTLRNKGGSFRPGQADEFLFRLPPLGALSGLRVGHDGRREWHLERVEVADGASGTTYYFPCEAWVKGSGTGGAMSRALQLRGYTTDPASLPVQYRVELAVEGATGRPGPDSLRLTLLGSRGESGAQRLDASYAAPGRPLVVAFEAANLGQLERLRIGLAAAAEGGPQCALLVSRVAVTNMVSGEAATFYCSEWLRSSDPFDFEVDAAEEQEELSCLYRVEVQTSDLRKAGTSGSVFLTIVGDGCSIGPYQLSNTESEHFQRGQLDVFEIDGAPDCGRLQQIEVRHDGEGKGAGWHLAWAKVTNRSTGAVAMFKCNRWVDRRGHQDPSIVAVVVALPPGAAAAVGSQRSAKDRLLLAGSHKAAAAQAAAQAPMVQDAHMEADAKGSPGEIMEGSVEVAEGGLPAPGYRVVFHTSRICGSGTKAKVHFELTGSRGSSGVLHPVGTSKSFGAGRLDIFDYPALPWLGELQSARVGTDGSGFFSAWHLAMVVVTHLPTGRVWQFSCFNWIDKKCNYSRWLALDSVEDHGTSQQAHQIAWSSKTPQALQKADTLVASATGGSWQRSLRHQQPYAGSPARRYSPQLRQPGSQASSPLHAKLQPRPLAGGAPGSPVLGQSRQWGAACSSSPAAPHVLYSSGSGVPGSPLIGAARRPSSGL